MENKKDLINKAIAEFGEFNDILKETTSTVFKKTIKEEVDSALEDEKEFDEEDVDTALEDDAETSDIDASDIETELDDAEGEDLEGADLDLDTNTNDTEDFDTELEDEETEDYDVVDMTQASDDEVIQVFKKMADSDEIEIVDDEVTITDPDSGNEYKIVIPNAEADAPIADDLDADLDADADLDLDSFDDEETEADEETELSTDIEGEDEEAEDDLDLDVDADMDAEVEDTEDAEGEDEEDEEIVFEVELNDKKSKKKSAIKESLDSDRLEKLIYQWIIDEDYLQNAHEWYTNQTVFLEIGISEFMEINGIDESKFEAIQNVAEKVVNEIGYYQWSGEDEEDMLDEQIPVGIAQGKRVTAAREIRGAGARNMFETFKKLNIENKALKETIAQISEQSARQVQALELFKEKINETKVTTKNLAAITKLFLEFSTTQSEKENIVESLTSAKTLEESAQIEKSLISQLSAKPTIKESVENKIGLNVTPSVSKTVVAESVYQDPSMDRMRKLMYGDN